MGWPEGTQAELAITCGGFLRFNLPEEARRARDNKEPGEDVQRAIFAAGEAECRQLIQDDLRQQLARHCHFLTLGVDSQTEKVSKSNVPIRERHAELVGLLDLGRDTYHWTGKSYPTTKQEDGLVRITDLKSHFVVLPIGKTMILGCHDLSVYNPRGRATAQAEWRKRIRRDFCTLARQEAPRIVLHHPHETVKARTWSVDWNILRRELPTVEVYAGAGRWFSHTEERRPIREVLDANRLGATLDLVATSTPAVQTTSPT